MNSYPPWGYPPYPTMYPQSGVIYMPPPPAAEKPKEKSLQDLIAEASEAEAAWKRLKKSLQEEKKDDEKKDDKKPKKAEFKMSFGDVFTLLTIGSFPMIWFQIHLLHYAESLFK